MEYTLIRLTDRPELKEEAASWFSQKWNIPVQAYLESIETALNRHSDSESPVPEWYLAMDHEKIIGGMGVIENDFHNRPDLTPNVCAVYTEKAYRGKGIAGALLHFVAEDMRVKGIDTLYLLTDHDHFYERYGWDFLCMVQGDGEEEMSRMYIHRS